jgi:uncharacterized protein (TIGR02118 family)
MVVIYRTPKDPKAFENHYFNVRVPLAKRLPGLKKYETSKGPILGMAGAVDPYFIATLHFESLNAIKSAFATELGQACTADRRVLAPNDQDFQMFLFEEQVVYARTGR